jgi:hypothetical protein
LPAGPAWSTSLEISTLLATDGFFQIGNYAEAGLWVLIAAGFSVFAVRRRGLIRRRCLLATTAFLLFGLSDVVEVQAGAWWRPWWLLCWKAGCVVAMSWLLWDHLRQRRNPA